MELDDIKHTWKAMKGDATLKKQTVNTEDIEKMVGQRYRMKLKRILLPELTGSIICLAGAFYIGLHFSNLDTYVLKATGVLAVMLLLLLPIISMLSTHYFNMMDNVNKPYAEALKMFTVQRIRFIRFQKLNLTLGYLLLVLIIVLLSKLLNGKDLSGNKEYWLFSFTIGFIFLLVYARWVERFYRKSLQQAEELLRDLNI